MIGPRSRAPWWLAAALAVVAALQAAVIGVWWYRDPDRARDATAVLRGARVADRMGCYGCHGPGGASGIPNPGAKVGDVPSWTGGTYMMYNHAPEEIREWIAGGAPRRLREDPKDIERRSRQLIAMPAYGDRLTTADLDDLAAWVRSVSGAQSPPEGPAAEGRALAAQHGCFGCHGPEGRGLVRNPGSFKGYIPAWDSGDYADLVRSPEEFHEWVADGSTRRFRDNPAAAHFLNAQAIRMPAFRGTLTDEEIGKLLAYVEWVRATAP